MFWWVGLILIFWFSRTRKFFKNVRKMVLLFCLYESRFFLYAMYRTRNDSCFDLFLFCHGGGKIWAWPGKSKERVLKVQFVFLLSWFEFSSFQKPPKPNSKLKAKLPCAHAFVKNVTLRKNYVWYLEYLYPLNSVFWSLSGNSCLFWVSKSRDNKFAMNFEAELSKLVDLYRRSNGYFSFKKLSDVSERLVGVYFAPSVIHRAFHLARGV